MPGLFGITYFIIFQTIKFGENQGRLYASAINTPGSIYENFVSTIFIFAILAVFYIVKNLKNKKLNFSDKLLINTVIFLAILFIGMKSQKVSRYYYFKAYYLIWIPLIYIAFSSIEILTEKNKKFTYTGIEIYCIGIIISIIFNKNLIFFDIYQKNFEEIKSDYNLISYKELDILEYDNKNINQINDNTYIYEAEAIGRVKWLYVITKNPYVYIDVSYGEDAKNIQQFLDSKKRYCIILKKDNCEEILKDLGDTEGIKIMFQNDAGAIIEKN